jgi:outer membrane immunogenic protein
MKKLLLASASVLALTVGAANAADIARPVYKNPPPPVAVPVPFSWTGFYIGAHIGSGWGTKEWDDAASVTGCAHSSGHGSANPTCVAIVPTPGGGGVSGLLGFDSSHTVNGFLGGGQIGYNYQIDWAVLGVEVQGSFADLTGHGSCSVQGLLNCRDKVDGLATFAGRFGFAVDHALIFIKGGGAWAHDKFTVTNNNVIPLEIVCDTEGHTCPIVGGTVKANRWGWMWGAGIEYAFRPNWSAKLEYDFLDLGTKSYVINDVPVFDIRQRIHLVKFGINYHFNWGKAPIVANY